MGKHPMAHPTKLCNSFLRSLANLRPATHIVSSVAPMDPFTRYPKASARTSSSAASWSLMRTNYWAKQCFRQGGLVRVLPLSTQSKSTGSWRDDKRKRRWCRNCKSKELCFREEALED